MRKKKIANQRKMMEFCHSHLTRNMFAYCMRRFLFGPVYINMLNGNCVNRFTKQNAFVEKSDKTCFVLCMWVRIQNINHLFCYTQ